jgi:hypothetical protein
MILLLLLPPPLLLLLLLLLLLPPPPSLALTLSSHQPLTLTSHLPGSWASASAAVVVACVPGRAAETQDEREESMWRLLWP